MEPLNSITLETDKVLLRPLSKIDFDDLLAQGQDENLWHWVYDNYCLTGEKLTNWFNSATFNPKKQLAFVIIDKQSGLFAGSTRLFNLDFHNQKLEIGQTAMQNIYC
jgi:RimJ/RimL family protein N-acetyltransferase